jgi:hypothetical protein
VRRLATSLSLAFLLLTALPTPAHLQEGGDAGGHLQELATRFEGRWQLSVSRGSAQSTIDAAVERVVGAMNYFLRGIARPRLRDATPIDSYYRFEFGDDDRVTVHFEGRDRFTTPLGRTRRYRTDDGTALRVTIRERGDALETVFQTDEGNRWYAFRANGATLTMTATTTGSMLPQAMRYQLTYRR